jgi:hypothetical protein
MGDRKGFRQSTIGIQKMILAKQKTGIRASGIYAASSMISGFMGLPDLFSRAWNINRFCSIVITRSKIWSVFALCFLLASLIQQGQALSSSPEVVMVPVSPIRIPETVWHRQTPQSPLTPESPGLAFRLAAADSTAGSTIALLGAYHLGSPYLDYYGGQLSRAIWVIAINLQNGHVYHADLNSPDHPPIMLEATDEKMAIASPGWSSESGYFNVDLPVLLRLPKESGTYKVFLWLDDLISNIETITIPENSTRGKGQPVKRIPVDHIQFGSDPALSKSKPDAVALGLIEKSGAKRVKASWFPIPAKYPEQPVLWLLATGHRDRNFGWMSVNANEIPQNLSPATLSLKIEDLMRTTGVHQKLFTVMVSASSVSNILVLQVP